MEKSLMLKEKFLNEFGLEEQDLRTYSPLTLAYIGDAIFALHNKYVDFFWRYTLNFFAVAIFFH